MFKLYFSVWVFCTCIWAATAIIGASLGFPDAVPTLRQIVNMSSGAATALIILGVWHRD